MKIIKIDNVYKITEGAMAVIERLPAAAYVVRFQQQEGFFLEEYGEIEVNGKIYGDVAVKIAKTFSTFGKLDRNMGVLLSGEKGIGKTTFLKNLASEAIARGMPVIIVDRYIPGIDSFLRKITQECAVLFDEYEKRFGEDCSTRGIRADGLGDWDIPQQSMTSMYSHQTELLELFDGISNGRKLFVLTCNDIRSINNYLIDRPGRIHYHFKFHYPMPKDILEYAHDNVKPEYQSECRTILNYSFFTKVSYDALRAIIFEVNTGLSTEEALKDLNISGDVRSCPEFFVSIHFNRGYVSTPQVNVINFYNDEIARVTLKYRKKNTKQKSIVIEFLINDLEFDEKHFRFTLPVSKIHDAYLEYDDKSDYVDIEELFRNDGVEYFSFSKRY